MVAPWKVYRECCCRYGYFPWLVIPIVTLGCCLSLYSSAGCKFVEVDIGFQPINEGWDASTPSLIGPLFYFNESIHYDNLKRESFHDGCVYYSDGFYDSFVEGDRTFKMVRVMAMLSCASSGLALLVSWLFVMSPIPVGILWSGALLPAVMIAFISEGSKFLLFDTALCRSAMWYQEGVNVPEQAESCTMGKTAWFACAAALLHFGALVCVCLRAPEHQIFQRKSGSKKETHYVKEEEQPSTDDLEGMESRDDSFLRTDDLEANGLTKGGGIDATNRSFRFREISNIPDCGAGDLSFALIPLDTNIDFSSGVECCSPLSEGNHVASPKGIPDIPSRDGYNSSRGVLSPVDCIIEGIDVATDLSQIDVCQTMVWSPTRKMLELEPAAQPAPPMLPMESQQPLGEHRMADSTPDTQIPELLLHSNGFQTQVSVHSQSLDGAARSITGW